jgi:hypothetical protein
MLPGGFLDGCAGFAYNFLQALWYLMLIDIKAMEMHREDDIEPGNVADRNSAEDAQMSANFDRLEAYFR